MFRIDGDFVLSADSRVLFHCYSRKKQELFIGEDTGLTGAHALGVLPGPSVIFESFIQLRAFTVPESIEILGDRCFGNCREMETIEFEGSSQLKRIGERAFAWCKLHSITIPASTEEIDGSAFVDCPLLSIQVAPGSLNFKVEGALLVTADGTKIVRYFGRDREIIIGKQVKVLRKSCFEGCKHLDRIGFEPGSGLARIGADALRGCESLSSIELPASVRIVEESSFEGCSELEFCLIAKDSSLVAIGARAFAKCFWLRSFYFPQSARGIGNNCFNECIHLYQLRFGSSECLQRVIGDRSLDDALEEFGVSASSSLLRIDFEAVRMELEMEMRFPGWVSTSDGDGTLQFSPGGDLQ
jgi:hypothetical protein